MRNPKQPLPSGPDGIIPVVNPTGTGRRAFTRYPVALNGNMIFPAGNQIACFIRDFCLSGILLNYKQPAANTSVPGVGDTLSVHCLVPTPQGEKKVIFAARVARITEDGAGLAFINPDHASLQLMQQFALQFPVDDRRNQNPILRGAKTDITNNKLLLAATADCNQVVERTLESLLTELCNKLTAHLFEISRSSYDPEKQNNYFNASEVIKKNTVTIQNSLRAGMHIRLSNPVQPATAPEQQDADLSLEDMSLIGDDDLGAWIAISDITGKIEEKNKEELMVLEERLSHLFNIEVRNANNPYGPALFVEPFQTALGQFELDSSVNNDCHKIFKEMLVHEAPGFYKKLNAALIDNGILPELTYKTLRRVNRAHSIKSAAVQSEANTSHVPGESQTPPHLDDTHDAPSADIHDIETLRPPHHYQVRAKTTHGENGAAPPDLYSVVQELRELKESIIRQSDVLRSPGQAAGLDSNPSQNSIDNYHSIAELSAVLTELQASGYELSHEERNNIKFHMLSGLAKQDAAGAAKSLNPQDANTLEVVGDLLLAMQGDPLVADSVRPWLKKLELPIIKLALEDPSVFVDQSHIARQVVNKIAQLEFYEQKENSPGQNAIGEAIEQLLLRIMQEHTNGTLIFEEIFTKLNALIKIQDKAYADNLRDTVQACQDHPPTVAECEVIDHSTPLGGEELRKWMMHAKRLKIDDFFLYRDATQTPMRLRLAWTDEERSVYVFINGRGLREKTLRSEDVAQLIEQGVLAPQINADDPPMDRAQYAIMQELYQQVLHQSTHDGTTGLINRREFENKLGAALASAKQDDTRHALMFIDVDKFSAINNSCGYAGGDRLLKDLIEILNSELDELGTMARIGSDEFGILLESCTIDDALAVAERQIEAVKNYRLAWDDNLFSVTLSIGLVPISTRSTDVGVLLQSAESSCNAAKDVGGNRLQLFHAGHARIAHRSEVMKWVGKIDKMLDEDALEIRCQRIQPIGRNSQGAPHYEILLGVNDLHGEIASPQEFIKAAEWYRRMPAIDRWVITKVFNWMADNPSIIDQLSGFAINLSGQSINEDGFSEFIMDEFKRIKVPYEKVSFEVTETVGISNLSDAALFIDRIKEVGCRFSLDDFGSGMSSYGYLKDLPVDIVKIDGAFVKHLSDNASDYAVVKSITDIAHVMNKKVVAEYVENEETLSMLQEIGVDYAQGYLIDKPGPLARLLTHYKTPAEPK